MHTKIIMRKKNNEVEKNKISNINQTSYNTSSQTYHFMIVSKANVPKVLKRSLLSKEVNPE